MHHVNLLLPDWMYQWVRREQAAAIAANPREKWAFADVLRHVIEQGMRHHDRADLIPPATEEEEGEG
jgi:hypothetical protein